MAGLDRFLFQIQVFAFRKPNGFCYRSCKLDLYCLSGFLLPVFFAPLLFDGVQVSAFIDPSHAQNQESLSQVVTLAFGLMRFV